MKRFRVFVRRFNVPLLGAILPKNTLFLAIISEYTLTKGWCISVKHGDASIYNLLSNNEESLAGFTGPHDLFIVINSAEISDRAHAVTFGNLTNYDSRLLLLSRNHQVNARKGTCMIRITGRPA
ncbi:hypothetical protein AB2I13_24380 (plasmid) [Escherichia coli]